MSVVPRGRGARHLDAFKPKNVRPPKIANFFVDGSPARVHLDVRHDYDSVAADIDGWAPKVKAGGWLSGDDYDERRWPGVVAAVRDRVPDSHGWLTAQVAVPQAVTEVP